MTSSPSLRDIRTELLDALHRDLIGPSEPGEVVKQAPRYLYAVGRLAPERTRKRGVDGAAVADVDQDDTGDGVDPDAATAEAMAPGFSDEQNAEDDTVIGEPVRRDALTPSSIGISCTLDDSVRSLSVLIRWGDYQRIEGEDGTVAWRRRQRECEVRGITIPNGDSSVCFPLVSARAAAYGAALVGIEDANVMVHLVTRRLGAWCAVSVFLVNRRPWARDADDERWMFQPEIRLSTPSGDGVFVARDHPAGSVDEQEDPDDASNDLLYRHAHEFAVGHGVSADCRVSVTDPSRASEVFTVLLPAHEVPRFEPTMVPGAEYDMKTLAELPEGAEAVRVLRPIVDTYGAWIIEREGEGGSLAGSLRDVAARHISLCREAADRIAEGIRLIESDRSAFAAFRFANRAMWDQRIHAKQAEARRKGSVVEPLGAVDISENRSWRPFQLAFILMVLPGIVNERHPARALVDLLWFPTGGGKTEAYLGLTAFVLAYRRLRGDLGGYSSEAGVSVIMRYTLRLLTIQQFQRASAMICACEVQRRKDPETWGVEPFSIGLWVGGETTPNSYDDAVAKITENRKMRRHVKGTPVQVLSCPRCGTSLVDEDGRPLEEAYRPDDGARRLRIYCPNTDCDFHLATGDTLEESAMPIVVIDDELYRFLPSLLVATVDKFAQIPFKGEAAALFGARNRYSPTYGHLTEAHGREVGGHVVKDARTVRRLVPPELIIQDELHLISGPLGTMVGLYESIIDRATSVVPHGADTVIPAKIIASTATIRRADRQVRSLYDRALRVFPQPGIDARDSFFARERRIDPTVDGSAGRLYAGVCAPGVSSKMLLVRTYAVLLAAAQKALDAYGSAADPYMTLVGYFNSLRALGGALRLVEDNVDLTRLKYLHEHEQWDFPRRYVNKVEEMTSRAGAAKIPGLLTALEQSFPRERKDGARPIDVLLATNMISVGVDIDRLGLMVVTGQPKATSEYIQATSRVGRKHPGLVVVVYNWPAPRDISHYEHFIAYHQSMYGHVEAVSATPFSLRAIDRGLPGLLAGLVRATVPGMGGERDAEKFRAGSEAIQSILDYLIVRAGALNGPDASRYLRREAERRCAEWEAAAQELLRYCWHDTYKSPPNNERVLLRFAGSNATTRWQAPGSLRGVESTAAFFIKG